MGTFQEFLQWSLTQSSTPNGPTIHQMAALSSYARDSLIVQRTSQIFNPTIYEHQADMVLSSKTPPMDYNFNYVYGPFFHGNNNHSGVGEEVIDDDNDDDESDSNDDEEDDETSSMDADNDNSRGFGTSNSSSKNETLNSALSTPNTAATNNRGSQRNKSIRKSQRIIARRSKDATDKQPISPKENFLMKDMDNKKRQSKSVSQSRISSPTPIPDEKLTNISKVAKAKKISNVKTPAEEVPNKKPTGKVDRNSTSSNKSLSPNLSKSSLKTPPSPLKKIAKGYATRSRASTNESSLISSNPSLKTSPISSASKKAAVNGKTDQRNSTASNESSLNSLNNSFSLKTPSSLPPKATRRSTRVRKIPPKLDAYFSPKLSEPDDDDEDEEKEIVNQKMDNENPKERLAFNPSPNITSAMLKSFPSSEFTDLIRPSNKQPSSDKIASNETSKSLLEINKFNHPTKPIKIEKIVGPQLLPNGSFPSKTVEEDPTQPLEFWFKSNLDNPFPKPREFSNLQYITGLGHLHIQQWFQNRRKVFCKLNPRNRPWKKQQQQPPIIPAKRPHSNSADEHNSSNNDENNLESIETPKNIPKNEVSEL